MCSDSVGIIMANSSKATAKVLPSLGEIQERINDQDAPRPSPALLQQNMLELAFLSEPLEPAVGLWPGWIRLTLMLAFPALIWFTLISALLVAVKLR